MPIISDLVEIKDERWCWPKYDNGVTYDALLKEMDLVDHITPLLKNKEVMVQAGGNCGMFIEPFVREFDLIYTFEPDPLNFYCLNLNLPYTHVIKFQACVGEKNQMVNINNNFTVDLKESGAIHVNPHMTGKMTIPMMKIDNLQLTSCDFIQFDIEGLEYWALMGAIETISKFKPLLCIEVNEHWMKRYGTSPSQLNELLVNKLGYVVKEKHEADIIYVCES